MVATPPIELLEQFPAPPYGPRWASCAARSSPMEPRAASRWMARSDWPVDRAVSAVNLSAGVASPSWRTFSLPFPAAPFFVSGCSASYISFRRRVNRARSAAATGRQPSISEPTRRRGWPMSD